MLYMEKLTYSGSGLVKIIYLTKSPLRQLGRIGPSGLLRFRINFWIAREKDIIKRAITSDTFL